MSWAALAWIAAVAAGMLAALALLRRGYATLHALSAVLERHDLDWLARIGWPATRPAPEPGTEGFAERPEDVAAWEDSSDRKWTDHSRAFAVEPRLLRHGLPEPAARTEQERALARRCRGEMAAGYLLALAVLAAGAALLDRAFLLPLVAVAGALAWRLARARPWPCTIR